MALPRTDEMITEDLRRASRNGWDTEEETKGEAEGNIGFSGKQLLELLKRPAPKPVEPGRPVPGHFSNTVAPAFSGKSSKGYWTAAARAKGVAPWEGATARPAGRVAIISPDEAAEQVVRRLHSLAKFHPAGLLARYADNLMVIGPDRTVEPSLLEALRLDVRGFESLEALLRGAQDENKPFAELYLDAYADFIPLGETENSNETATNIGKGLEHLAVRFDVGIDLLHHAGKPKLDSQDLADLRFLGRGASALAAKARAVFAIEKEPTMPTARRIRTITNLGPAPAPLTLEVCSTKGGNPDDILFFRRTDPAHAHDPKQYLSKHVGISTAELARLIFDLEPGTKPSSAQSSAAASIRESWRRDGLAEVTPGPGNSKTITLACGGK